ncbi:MAG: hypothetical protein GTN36_01420 [Candidatus Aenigmarchaeota archaeon]|nr:hypothetical protein [Candidatus Aenigmarchaeota archaeon]
MTGEEYIYEKSKEEEENVEYIYKKPKETKRLILILILIAILISLIYFIFTNTDIEGEEEFLDNETYYVYNETQGKDEHTYTIGDQTFTIPPEYNGIEALDYVRENYSSSFSEAQDFCINQFNGDWIDESERIGCYDMEDFFILFCSMKNIMNILDFCYSIEGMPTCSSTEVSCTL